MVVPEMKRLVDELRSEAFLGAHPVVQAAYSHYAFILIHPFSDGNGRVARLLASLYLCRARSIPLLVLADERDEYLRALRSVDGGDHQALVDFVFECARTAFVLARESLAAGATKPFEESVVDLERLYVTKGGYAHHDIDLAAAGLLDVVVQGWEARMKELQASQQRITATESSKARNTHFHDPGPDYRPARQFSLFSFGLQAPAASVVALGARIQAEVPRDAGESDCVRLRCIVGGQPAPGTMLLEVPLPDLLPRVKSSVKLRCNLALDRVVAEMMAGLTKAVAKSFGLPE
jgi:hypothetical protein